MIEEFDHTILNRVGHPLHLTVTPATNEADVVILVHGFKGFRHWGFFPLAAQHLALNGFTAVRMDLSLNGMEGGVGLVTKPDDFGRSTISRDVDDVHDVLFWLQHDGIRTTSDLERSTFHLVGHSRGGGVVQIVGRETMNSGLLGKVVAWNSVGKWDRWTQRQREHWLEHGRIDVENSRTGQKLQIFTDLLHDIEDHTVRLSLELASKALGERLLFIHADADLTTPIHEVQDLIERSTTTAELAIMHGSTHTFGISHPLQRVTGTFTHVLDKTVQFLQQ